MIPNETSLKGQDYFRYLTAELDLNPLRAIIRMRQNNHDLSWFDDSPRKTKHLIVRSVMEIQKIRKEEF
mgnify:CR=1 FL=1